MPTADRATSPRTSERLAVVSASVSTMLGVLGLLGWLTPWRQLATLGSRSIPMAPSTAIALVLLGGALLLEVRQRWPHLTVTLAVSVTALASVQVWLFLAGLPPVIDALLIPAPELFNGVPTGRMSPWTGLGLVVASITLFLLSFNLPLLAFSRASRALDSLAAGLALAVCSGASVVTLGYLVDAPLLYGSSIVPMALPTAVAIGFVGLGLIGLAPTHSAPLQPIIGQSSRARLLRAFLPVAAAVLVLGVTFPHFEFDPGLATALEVLLSVGVVGTVVVLATRHVARDLDRAQHLDEQSRRHSDRLAAIVESSSDAIFATALDGTIVAWNAGAVQVFGYSTAEALGQPVQMLSPPGANDRSDSFGRIRAGERVEHEEATRLRKGGGEIEVSLAESPLRSAAGELIGISVIARDVSLQRQAERALRESEAKLRALFESDLVGIVFGDVHGNIKDANDKFLQMVGYTRVDLELGLRWKELTAPEFQELNAIHVAEARQSGSCTPYEKQYIRKDGTRLWVLLGLVFLEPERERSVAFVLDIDDRKRAETELRDSEQRFARIFHSGLIAIGIADVRTGRVIDVNHRWEQFFGYTRDEVIGRTVFELRLWEDEGQRARLSAGLPVAGASPQIEVGLRRKSGEIRQALVSLEAITLPGAADPRTIVSIVDMTEHHRLERQLLENASEYQLLFDHNPFPMWVFDSATLAFLAVNDAAVRLYGFTREEFLAMTILGIRPPAEVPSLLEYLKTIPSSPSLTAVHVRHQKRDGSFIEVDGASNPIQYRGRAARLVMVQDVSQTRRLEAQLRQAQKMEAVGQLAGGVAHDFNNLLGVIIGYTELLMRQTGDGQRAKLEQILAASERAAGLTRQLLAFSRQQIVHPRVLDLNALLSNLETLLGRLIGEDVDLAIIAGGNLGRVAADPGQLEQVVMNLCVNARDAMPDGGLLRIETANADLDDQRASVHESPPAGHYVLLSVSDTGCGMPKEVLSRLFEPFFTTKEPGSGTGLGLAMVYGIVKQAGGFVWAYSELGQGTTFKIYLPRVDAPADAYVIEKTQTPETGWKTLLLVEDEDSLRALAREVLQEHGYRVLDTGSPKEALEIAAQFTDPIHLLLTDVVMPGMSGRALAELLVAQRPNLMVLYMSGYTDDIIARRGVLERGVHLLEKPFTVQALLERVQAALTTQDTNETGGGDIAPPHLTKVIA